MIHIVNRLSTIGTLLATAAGLALTACNREELEQQYTQRLQQDIESLKKGNKELKDSLNAHGDTDLSKLKETIKALETENRQLYEEEVKLPTRFDQLCNELETHNARFDEVAAVKAELDFDFNQEKEAAEKKKQDISVNP